MKRVENWERKLTDFIDSRLNVRMEWGKTDCFLLIFDSVQVITGFDPDEIHPDKPFRGRYHTARQAYNLLKKYSGGGMEETCDMIAEKMNMGKKQKNFAGRGDVVLLHLETAIGGMRDIMGICLGHVVAVQGINGIIFVDKKEIKKAWSL